jgi:hypothetical protein
MAVEEKRGCGYRKVGGLYLICFGAGRHCGKMPVKCEVCPTCNAGIKPTRGWTWIDPVPHFAERACDSGNCRACPLGSDNLTDLGPVGLIWIGEQFYPTPQAFVAEAGRMGISRRIPAIPKGFSWARPGCCSRTARFALGRMSWRPGSSISPVRSGSKRSSPRRKRVTVGKWRSSPSAALPRLWSPITIPITTRTARRTTTRPVCSKSQRSDDHGQRV